MISAVLLGTGFAAFQVSTAPPPAAVAADGRDFKPGNIISDAVFYNSSAMTAAQVQSFLNARVPSCRAGYTCLKDFRQTTGSQPARSEGCAAYAGRSNETAATIISRVASACGINPQALIVLLEKEQSLITDTWPTDRQYRSATGYGCPDTADCNANYYGFFNQVYHAAWQFKKYRARPLDRGYIAGRNNTILWHPNTGCGSSTVFIENQATAGLYVYTPYRPNAAALNNLYGTGDGCSSYGNRNFWRIFTDWFGPTTGGPAPVIVRADGQSAVYLVDGSTKHHISADDYPALLEAFGPRQVVSKAFVDGLTSGAQASIFLHNSATGVIAMVEGGQTHRFPSCAIAELWGSGCTPDKFLNVSGALFSRAKAGAQMTKFAVAPNGKTHLLEGTVASPMANAAAAAAFNSGKAPFAAKMPKAQFARFSVAKTLAGPATFVKTADRPEVYLIDGRNRRYHLPAWSVAGEYGLPQTHTVIPKSVMDGYSDAGELSLLVKCWTPVWAVGGGKITQLTAADYGGTPVTRLELETCRKFPVSTAKINGPLFYKASNAADVYMLRKGKLHRISSKDQQFLQNRGSTPTVVTVSPATLQRFTMGAPALDIGSFVRRTGQTDVFFVNGWQLVPITGWSVADAYGKPRTVKVVGSSTWSFSAYSKIAQPLSVFAKCYSTYYVASKGTLYEVTQSQIGSNPVSVLDASVCRRLPRKATPPPAGVLRETVPEVAPRSTPAVPPTPTPTPTPEEPSIPQSEPVAPTEEPSTPAPEETAIPSPGPTEEPAPENDAEPSPGVPVE